MDIIRAWKDEEYRLSLTEEQLALLPDNPAGLMELSNEDLEGVVGGFFNSNVCTVAAVCAFSFQIGGINIC